MLKLNNLTSDDLTDYLDDNPEYIKIWLPIINQTTETLEQRERAAFNLTSCYLELAYTHYALENFNEVKPYFEKAAPFAYLRGFDAELKTSKVDWTIQQEMNVVILFGDSTTINKLAHSDWSLAEDFIINQACYLYDHLLLKLGTQQPLCQSEIDTALTQARNTKDKDVQQYILPLINAINALVNGQQAQWQAAIDMAIAWHTDECKFGDLKNMIEGFICLNALTMAKLGKDMHQWQCTTESLYLPLFLID